MHDTLPVTPFFAHGALFHEYNKSYHPPISGNKRCRYGFCPLFDCADESSATDSSCCAKLWNNDIYITAGRFRCVERNQRRGDQYTGACRGKRTAHQRDHHRRNGDSGICGAYGYAAGGNAQVYIHTSGNATNGVDQLALAINTMDIVNVKVSYKITAISDITRAVGVVLQYRVGATGTWTTVPGTTYFHGNGDRLQGVEDLFTDLILPQDAGNQPVVQLRWRSGVELKPAQVRALASTISHRQWQEDCFWAHQAILKARWHSERTN